MAVFCSCRASLCKCESQIEQVKMSVIANRELDGDIVMFIVFNKVLKYCLPWRELKSQVFVFR